MDIFCINVNMKQCYIILLLAITLLKKQVVSETSNSTTKKEIFGIKLNFVPENMTELYWKDTHDLEIVYTCANKTIYGYNDSRETDWVVNIISRDPSIVQLDSSNEVQFQLNCTVIENNNNTLSSNGKLVIPIDGKFLGFTVLDIYLSNLDLNINYTKYTEYNVAVINEETALYTSFIVIVAILIVLLNFGFGCVIHIETVKKILKKPVAPALGLFCQIIIMPLLGVAITKIFKMDPMLGFGLFVVACAPGGSGSNVWTYLLNGDLDLSMTMTLCSKTLALGTMPAWLYAMSRIYITDDVTISIPYTNLFTGLLSIVIPLILGLLLNKLKPHIAKKISKAIKPLSIVFIIWVLAVGSITNLYVYTIMGNIWYVVPAGTLLAYLGMTIGFVIAKLLRQPMPRVTAISIETGIQDSGIGILLLLSSFDKPLGSIASTMAIVIATSTPLPLLISFICLSIYRYCWVGGKCVSCGGPEVIEKTQVPLDDRAVGDNINDLNDNEGQKHANRTVLADDSFPPTFHQRDQGSD